MNAHPAPAPRPRLGAVLFALIGALFVLYPAVRPDETKGDAATALASDSWIAAHMFAVIGFVLLPLAVSAIRDILQTTRGGKPARTAFIATALGTGLTLPYYGAEIFGVHEMASRAIADGNPGLLDMVDSFRFHPVAVTIFALGLGLIGVGAVLAAIAIWRSGTLPKWSGTLFGLGFALFIPQFFTPMPVRVVHGVIIGIGALWTAYALWRAKAA